MECTLRPLPPAPLFFLEVVALLPGRLYDIKDRLPLTLEVKSTATISEMGIVGDVVVGAVVATCWLVGWFDIHGCRHSANASFKKDRCVYPNTFASSAPGSSTRMNASPTRNAFT